MKNNATIKRNLAVVLMAACSLSVLSVASCKKTKSERANAKFVGTWHGTTSCTFMGSPAGASAYDYVLTAGADDNSLTSMTAVGSDSACIKNVTLKLTASGNNITIPSQPFTDNCGETFTISGNGTLNGTTLSFTQNISFSAMGMPLSVTCTFTGTK